MLRFAVVLVLVFLALAALRLLRVFAASLFGGAGPRAGVRRGEREGEMVRDPMCGTWIDRRLALTVRRGENAVSVCSEKCRRLLEGSPDDSRSPGRKTNTVSSQERSHEDRSAAAGVDRG